MKSNSSVKDDKTESLRAAEAEQVEAMLKKAEET